MFFLFNAHHLPSHPYIVWIDAVLEVSKQYANKSHTILHSSDVIGSFNTF